jgi:predicted nuclease of predicted toxin-antitoxin system
VRILLDECLPTDLQYELPGYDVSTVGQMGWSGIKNGTLLALAEQEFDVFLTADRNIEYQQNMQKRQIILVVLVASNTKIETLRPLIPSLLDTLQSIVPGVVSHVSA